MFIRQNELKKEGSHGMIIHPALAQIMETIDDRRKRDQAYGQLSNSADLEASLRFQEQEAKMAKKGEALKKLLRMALSEPKPASADKFPKQERRSKRCSVSSVSSLEDSKEPGKGDEDQYLSRGILADAVTNILLAMTKKDIVPFQLLAIKILWALSADFDACHLIANAGGVARLLNLLKEGGSPTNDHRMLSLDALQSFAITDRNTLIALRGVDVILDVARFGDQHLHMKAAMCLRNITLQYPSQVIPFGAIVAVNLDVRKAQAPDEAESAIDLWASLANCWPGLALILESAGVMFEVSVERLLDANYDSKEQDITRLKSMPEVDFTGWTPSILFISHRFGFRTGSEQLLELMVRDAVLLGWNATVMAQVISQRTYGFRVTSDANVLKEKYDLCIMHQAELETLGSLSATRRISVLLMPTNTTAGLSGLRVPSRGGCDDVWCGDVRHVPVNHRKSNGLCAMTEGVPASRKPLGVSVHLVSIPSCHMMLERLRHSVQGVVEVTIKLLQATGVALPPKSLMLLSATAHVKGKEIYRTRPSRARTDPVWVEEFSLRFRIDHDRELITFAVTPVDAYGTAGVRDAALATTSCPLGILRESGEETRTLRLKRRSEANSQRERPLLHFSVTCKWSFAHADQPDRGVQLIPGSGQRQSNSPPISRTSSTESMPGSRWSQSKSPTASNLPARRRSMFMRDPSTTSAHGVSRETSKTSVSYSDDSDDDEEPSLVRSHLRELEERGEALPVLQSPQKRASSARLASPAGRLKTPVPTRGPRQRAAIARSSTGTPVVQRHVVVQKRR